MSEWLNRVHFGDCPETLRNMPDGIVNTCVTSPPYFGLRDYGHPGQIGLEETPEQFIGKLVEVFREVRRVLRDDGTCWVNMGDSYSSGGRDSRDTDSNNRGNAGASQPHRPGPGAGVKPKDLIGVPWMLAFALRADGWYLRQDIIWAKPNPMPESVTDRCTKSHEYIFLLSKSPRYYCDMVAIKEDGAGRDDLGRMSGHGRIGAGGGFNAPGAGPRSKRDSFKRDDSKRAGAIPGQAVGTHRADREESEWDTDRRNKRSVWIVSTKPYSGAHFATFPPDLIEPCILAGAPAGGVVLDPFMGSGTTASVATRLGRQWIGCELNPDYEPLQRERLAGQTLGLEFS